MLGTSSNYSIPKMSKLGEFFLKQSVGQNKYIYVHTYIYLNLLDVLNDLNCLDVVNFLNYILFYECLDYI